MFCYRHRIVTELILEIDQSDPAYTDQHSSHQRLCFNLNKEQEKLVMLCELCMRVCVCVWQSLSQEMTRVFRHADAGLALGEREGNRRRERGKMKEKNYFEKL